MFRNISWMRNVRRTLFLLRSRANPFFRSTDLDLEVIRWHLQKGTKRYTTILEYSMLYLFDTTIVRSSVIRQKRHNWSNSDIRNIEDVELYVTCYHQRYVHLRFFETVIKITVGVAGYIRNQYGSRRPDRSPHVPHIRLMECVHLISTSPINPFYLPSIFIMGTIVFPISDRNACFFFLVVLLLLFSWVIYLIFFFFPLARSLDFCPKIYSHKSMISTRFWENRDSFLAMFFCLYQPIQITACSDSSAGRGRKRE